MYYTRLIPRSRYASTRHHFPNVSSNSLICVLYITAVLIWLTQLRLRLRRKEERSYLGFCSFADRFPDGYPYNKIYIYPGKYSCPSIYLVSLLFSPDLCGTFYVFCCVIYRKALRLFHFSQMEAAAHPCTSHSYWVSLPMICTSWHSVFPAAFPIGWKMSLIHTGPFYIASLIWLAVMFGAILILSFVHCISMDCRRNIWMPCIPLAAALIYLILFLKDPYSPLQRLFKTTDMITFLFPAFMEALIQAGLFPSNDQYSLMWKVSDLGAGIMDMQGKICYQSEKSLPVTENTGSCRLVLPCYPCRQQYLGPEQPSDPWRLWLLADRSFPDPADQQSSG